MVQRRVAAGGGLKLQSENNAPHEQMASKRGSKRVRADENVSQQLVAGCPAVKRSAASSAANVLKPQNGNLVVTGTQKATTALKEKNANQQCQPAASAVHSKSAAAAPAVSKKDLLQSAATAPKLKQQNNADTKEASKTTLAAPAAQDALGDLEAFRPSPAKRRCTKKVTNVMVDLNEVCPLDFYVEKTDLPSDVPDVDRKVVDDPNCEAHYAHGAFEYMRQRERHFLVPSYIEQQPEMSSGYRALLVDWMVEVQESFELNHETLYLAVKIVDRYLSRKQIRKAHIQLLGATAMLIASKMDERVPPSLDEFTYICDDAYSKSQFIEMERKVLVVLDFDLSMPLSYSFLRRFCRSIELDMREMTLARFILECSLMDYSIQVAGGQPESHMAAAALLLALDVLGKQWNSTLTYYTGYEASELVPMRNMLNKLVQHLCTQCRQDERATTKTIVNKYSHEVFHKVATMEFPPLE